MFFNFLSKENKMKKLVYCCIFILMMLFTMNASAAPMAALGATSITGNSASLDAIPYTKYKNGALAFVPIIADEVIFFYVYDGTINSAESLPDIVIPNDNTTGVGAWKKIASDAIVDSVAGDSTEWLYGNTVPAVEDGEVGDFYLNLSTSDLYIKDTLSLINALVNGTVISDIVDADLAFDGDNYTFTTVTTVPASITYDLGGVSIVPGRCLVEAMFEDNATDLSIYASNDNVEWTTLTYTVLDSYENEYMLIDFDTDIDYRYFKIECVEASSGFSIATFEIYPDDIIWNYKTNIRGDQGIPGSRWYTGNGSPLFEMGSAGNVGDYYLDLNSADVYRRTQSEGQPATWTLVGNLTPSSAASVVGLDVEPPNPASGSYVMWMNNVDQLQDAGIAGAAGDIMIKTNIGGQVRINTIFDYSAAVLRNPM